MTTRAKRVERHLRNPAMARDSETMRRAAGTRWTPENRVRTALKTLRETPPEIVERVRAELDRQG